jgi:hypothetical protein
VMVLPKNWPVLLLLLCLSGELLLQGTLSAAVRCLQRGNNHIMFYLFRLCQQLSQLCA